MGMFQNVKDSEIREIIRILNNVDLLLKSRTNLEHVTWKTISGYLASVLVDLYDTYPELNDQIEMSVGLFKDEDVNNLQ